MEHRLQDDHKLVHDKYTVRSLKDGIIVSEEVPALNAINARLRDDYVTDASGGLKRWNKIDSAGKY